MSAKPPKKDPGPPSETFLDVLIGSGSCVADCGFCGRVHFDYNGDNMEPGELEGLERKQKADPDKYCGHDGTVRFGYLSGKQFVADCPCNEATLYEKFIWNHRYLILEFLNAKATGIVADVLPVARNARRTLKLVDRAEVVIDGKTERSRRVFDFEENGA